MKRFCFRSLAIILSFAALTLNVSQAHDLKGYVAEQKRGKAGDRGIAASLNSFLKLFHGEAAKVRARSVIVTAYLWPANYRLSICFSGGSRGLRHRIVSVMQARWPLETLTNGALAYGDSFSKVPSCYPWTVADIHVGFLSGPDGGYWSDIGTESREDRPSMNFEGFDTQPPPSLEFDRIVAHEFGHALGLHHEHQSPHAPDCKWAYNVIRTKYQWASDADMHANLDKLKNALNSSGRWEYQTSDYDQLSLMHYFFNADAFIDGEHDDCYIPNQNDVPSETDLDSIRKAYGSALGTKEGVVRSFEASNRSKLKDPAFARFRILLEHKATLLTKP